MRHEFERWSVGAARVGTRATAAEAAPDDTATVPAGEATSPPLQGLIELGLARGFLTRGDIVDALPQHADDDAQIAAATMTLRELGIAVREAAATQPAWPPERHFVNADAVPGAPLDLLVGHTSDPVKLYLREMGTTPLLEREEEIALALRLERGRIACIEALSGDPDALDALVSIQLEIRAGTTPATYYASGTVSAPLADRPSVSDDEAAERPADEEAPHEATHDSQVINEAVIARLEPASPLAIAMRDALGSAGRTTGAYWSLKRQSAGMMRPLRLNSRSIEQMSAPLRQRVAEARLLAQRLDALLAEAGVAATTHPAALVAPSSDADAWVATCVAAYPERRTALLRRAPALADVYRALARLAGSSSLPLATAFALDARLARIERAVQEARQTLFRSNLRLVVSVAKRHTERGMPLLDLIQEGNIGLMKAVDRYDVRRGFRFSTYATWWVRQAITHALADQGRMIRVPTHTADALGKLSRLAREHAQRDGSAAAPAALAARMGVSVDKVRELMSIVKEPLCADLPVTSESDQTLTDTFADLDTPTPEDHASAAQLRAAVASVIGSLPRREAWILRLRYGIDVACEHSLREIGEQLHLSAERVRQIEAAALERIRGFDHLPTLRSLIRCDR
ncbi:sigma-70 family RNA polymerase sigma factor [Paraburkholderia sp. UYCP14C]|uniref:sigma-70 family RNA polymerase sigma factor n=1 Tax=Paraburkholderia sp. UYCP14C TaxID=2511130 RepID=UPI0020071597|nr:sigma-70 family RNA polymerase sigma factor [Paraburkholderia sp. UYCP14C]